MKTLNKVIRIIVLAFLIILALSGVLGAFLPATRERYLDKETRIERVDKKRNEGNEEKE